jgi:hypothetical protein
MIGREEFFIGKMGEKYIHRDQEDEKDSKRRGFLFSLEISSTIPLLTFIPVRFFFSLSQGEPLPYKILM